SDSAAERGASSARARPLACLPGPLRTRRAARPPSCRSRHLRTRRDPWGGRSRDRRALARSLATDPGFLRTETATRRHANPTRWLAVARLGARPFANRDPTARLPY